MNRKEFEAFARKSGQKACKLKKTSVSSAKMLTKVSVEAAPDQGCGSFCRWQIDSDTGCGQSRAHAGNPLGYAQIHEYEITG